jgi:hypothetical protein
MNKEVLVDPIKWANSLNEYMSDKLQKDNYTMNDYSCDLRVYGWNAVSNVSIKPGEYMPREIGVMLVVTAKTQEQATEIAKAWNPHLLHYSIKKGNMYTYAFPFSPNEIDRGPLYEFMLNHAVEVDSPLELVRMQMVHID